MTDLVDLEIVTAHRVLVRTRARDVYVPAARGRAGILHHHLPYTALLGMGAVSYTDAAGKKHSLFLRGGLVETLENRVVILTERVLTAEELDAEALEKELAAVRKTIKDAVKGETSPEELEKALEREKELAVKREIAGSGAGSKG